jgi:membrane-anchored protein YejM (alkaline phosphatase superfamily)
MMRFEKFFLVAALQIFAILLVSTRILQEVFVTNPNFLSDFSLSPILLLLLACFVFGFLSLRLRLAATRGLAISSAIIYVSGLVISPPGTAGLFVWMLVLLFHAGFLLLCFEVFLANLSNKMRIIFVALNALLTSLAFIDWQVFFVTRAHLNYKILKVVFQEQALLARAAGYFGVKEQQLIGELLVLIVVPALFGIFFKNRVDRFTEKPRGVVFLIVATLLFTVHYNRFDLVCQKVPLAQYINLRVSAGILPLPLHPELAQSSEFKKVLAQKYQIDMNKCYEPAEIEWLPDSCEKIVFIGIESLRFDAFKNLMSGLKNLARQGRVFSNHYSTANISLSSFYSLFHANFPVNLLFSEKVRQQSVFEQTALKNGYETYLVRPNLVVDLTPWGEKKYVEKIEEPWKSTPAALQKTFELLQKPGKAVFLTYLFNTHFNYFYPDEFERFKPVCPADTNIFVMPPTPENVAKIRNRYINSVLWADKCLADFFADIYACELHKKTTFVIFGDHGQSLRENGCLGHGTGAHHLQYQVPLIIIGPKTDPETISRPTTHLEVLRELGPTVGFNFRSSLATAQKDYPLLVLEESVKGRILVVHEDCMNIFDLSPTNQLKWIAILDRNYSLNPDLIEKYYRSVEKLAQTIFADFSFIMRKLG